MEVIENTVSAQVAPAIKEIYTTEEACEILHMSHMTLWRERKAGRIAYRRCAGKILFTSDDILQYLESLKRPAVTTAIAA